jgi:hypothetical protein
LVKCYTNKAVTDPICKLQQSGNGYNAPGRLYNSRKGKENSMTPETIILNEAINNPALFQQMEIVILALILIFKTQIGIFFGWLKSLITKKKNRTLNERLDSIERAIKKLFAVVDKHGAHIEEREINDLKNTLFGDRDAFSQMKAGIVLIAKGINGRVPIQELKIALENKEIWLNAYDWMQSAIKEGKLEIADKAYFDETIKMVHQKINDCLFLRK